MSMQPIQYETDTVVSDVGGESNTNNERSYAKLGHSHEHYLYHNLHSFPVLMMASLLSCS